MGFRINSTGRKRILREHVQIRLFEGRDGQAPSFTANIQIPAELQLDPLAKIYVEPYVKSSSMRFAFGTISALEHPESCTLSEIDAGATVLFRVKVVDEAEELGRILASANGIRAEDDADGDDRRPLLPVRSSNLGEEIWKLEIDREGGPILVVNSRVPDLLNTLKTDVVLQGLIYPEVVRRLTCEVFKEGSEFEDDDWIEDWRGWIADQLGREVSAEEVDEQEGVSLLADEVAIAFANKNRFASSLIAAKKTTN